MSEIGKIELDDDVLDKVSGGATNNGGMDCPFFTKKNLRGAPTCDNCTHYNNDCHDLTGK